MGGWKPTGGGGGGSGALTLIDHQELTTAAFNITFASIPATYKSLRLIAVLRSDRAANDDELAIRVGAGTIDTGTNYGYARLIRGSVAVTDASNTAAQMFLGPMAGNNLASGIFGVSDIVLPYYADFDHHRTAVAHSRVVGASFFISETTGRWANTASAIDTIRLFPNTGPNWIAGSKATLYGMS